MRTRISLFVIGAVLLASAGVQVALATTPNDVQYSTPTTATTTTGSVKGQTQFRPPTTTTAPAPLATAKTGGTLPFTGLDLGIVSVGGILVLAGGFGLRRLGRKNSTESD